MASLTVQSCLVISCPMTLARLLVGAQSLLDPVDFRHSAVDLRHRRLDMTYDDRRNRRKRFFQLDDTPTIICTKPALRKSNPARSEFLLVSRKHQVLGS